MVYTSDYYLPLYPYETLSIENNEKLTFSSVDSESLWLASSIVFAGDCENKHELWRLTTQAERTKRVSFCSYILQSQIWWICSLANN